MTEDPRIREIRAVLDEVSREQTGDGFYFASKLAQVKFILDSAPPAPQVFLVGDTVPAVTPVVNHVGGVWRHHADRIVKTGWAVELQLPDETDLQAAVDRVRDTRADQLRAAMVEADRNYQPPPSPEPGADRWVHLRNTCPHGIVRGLITCPVCDPEKQSAAEASARAAVDRAHAALGGPALTTDAELHALTPDQLEKCIHRALKAHDVQAVEGYLLLMTLKDPHRAADIVETLKVGIRLAEERAIPEPTEGQNRDE